MRRPLVVALLLVVQTARADAPCNEAISAANAQRLFDLMKAFKGADECALEQIKTERDVMFVTFVRGAVKPPPIEVRPRSCAGDAGVVGPALAMAIPPQTAADCPLAIAEMTKLVTRETFGGVVRTDQLTPPPVATNQPRSRSMYAIAAGALVVVAFLVMRRRR